MENWAVVTGMIIAVSDHPSLTDYMQFSLELKSTEDVEGFPNMARADEGTTIVINVRREQKSDSIKLGAAFTGTVRKAFGQVYFLK